MMKIAIDARKWRDYGIGTYVRNVVGHLAHLDRETTYFLFCQRSDESTLRDLAENFVPVVEDSAGYSLQEHDSIPLKLRRLGADLIHSPHYVLPLLCRTPAVVTIHDCIHLLFPQYLPNRFAWQYARFMMGSAIHRSALIFTVSEASRRDILRFYPEADPELLQVVPNHTLAALYRLASVFVFPSLYEGFGLPPLEAMACGTPVVTSSLSSLPEVVGDAAVLVDPYHPEDIARGLEEVLCDPALQADLSARGRARAHEFSWERSAQAIHAGYLKVLGVSVPAVAAEETR